MGYIKAFAAVALIVTAGAALYWSQSPEGGVEVNFSPQYAATAPDDPAGIERAEMPLASVDAVMSHPNVQRYLQREARKERLQGYFDDIEHGDSEEAWRLINDIEREGGVLAYEALALKLAWLERNSADKASFDRAAKDLLETYRQRAEKAGGQYDPHRDVPGFSEYKSMERKIVEEVQAMQNFPDDMTRDEYLRKRLQQAREQAYGS